MLSRTCCTDSQPYGSNGIKCKKQGRYNIFHINTGFQLLISEESFCANKKSFGAERFSVVLRTIFKSQHNGFRLSAVNNIYLTEASSHSEKHPFATVRELLSAPMPESLHLVLPVLQTYLPPDANASVALRTAAIFPVHFQADGLAIRVDLDIRQ